MATYTTNDLMARIINTGALRKEILSEVNDDWISLEAVEDLSSRLNTVLGSYVFNPGLPVVHSAYPDRSLLSQASRLLHTKRAYLAEGQITDPKVLDEVCYVVKVIAKVQAWRGSSHVQTSCMSLVRDLNRYRNSHSHGAVSWSGMAVH